MPKQWHNLRIVTKCDHDKGYAQDITFWVEAYGREAAVVVAMLDNHVYSDGELISVHVIATRVDKPPDADVIRDKDRD